MSKLLIVASLFTVNAQMSPFMSVKEMEGMVDPLELLGNFESDLTKLVWKNEESYPKLRKEFVQIFKMEI